MAGIQTAAAGAGAREGVSCSNRTLKGTYRFNVSGSLAAADKYVPDAYAGFVIYDGLGNIVLKKTSFIAGNWTTRVTTGIYSIAPDCTGTATYPGAAEFKYYVAPDGSSLSFVKISNFIEDEFVPSPDRISATAERVSRRAVAGIMPPPI